ncbi:hypothetical protein G5714_013758 [Onychostoma macrolepis]|uniref:Uncharacterized protein n=1 Tax=Onychostoma macrolepis TaxID=369639 RepID=A0A7J6CG48_9TELE|nr:hypothetical protein G5714_013758 [Onychostoma macrolepis]
MTSANADSRGHAHRITRYDWSVRLSVNEILRAYRAQKDLDFEDPYEPSENRVVNGSGSVETFPAFGTVLSNGVEVKIVSPKQTDKSGLSGIWA